MNAYQQSLKIKRDNYSVIETAEWRGAQRERTKAEKEKAALTAKAEQDKVALTAKAEQEKAELKTKALEEKKEMARQMIAENEPLDKIARYTKLSLEEIKTLGLAK